jgi:hypothetical protein
MSDTKKKQHTTTIEEISDNIKEIRDLIKESNDKNMVQYEQLCFKMEGVLTRRTPVKPKKPVVVKDEKESKEKEPPVEYSNTMYFWVGQYVLKNPIHLKQATADDVKKAEESVNNIKDKPEGYDYPRAISLAIWKGFPKAKKTGELKTMYDNWKKNKAKHQAKDVEKEKTTDDDKEEEDNASDDDA